jgi:multidrug resistance efflux pump
MHVRSRRMAGAALWGAAFVLALFWGGLDQAGVEGTGYGFAPAVNVAATETARVLEVPVRLHDAVGSDQVVVRMDAAPIQGEVAVAQAQLLAVQEEAAATALSDARRFAAGAEAGAIRRARLMTTLQEDLVMVETLREQLSIEQDLAGTGASSTQAVAGWQRQIRVVEARIAANRSALSVSSAESPDGDDPQPGQWATVAMARQVEALEARISRMELRAGIQGQVTWIYRVAGEVVPAGEPVMQVRATGTREVVAFLSPAAAAGLEAGQEASVKRSTGQVVSGHLRSVGAGPQPLPVNLWKLPDWPEFGVPVVVDLDTEIAPDETVTVRI